MYTPCSTRHPQPGMDIPHPGSTTKHAPPPKLPPSCLATPSCTRVASAGHPAVEERERMKNQDACTHTCCSILHLQTPPKSHIRQSCDWTLPPAPIALTQRPKFGKNVSGQSNRQKKRPGQPGTAHMHLESIGPQDTTQSTRPIQQLCAGLATGRALYVALCTKVFLQRALDEGDWEPVLRPAAAFHRPDPNHRHHHHSCKPIQVGIPMHIPHAQMISGLREDCNKSRSQTNCSTVAAMAPPKKTSKARSAGSAEYRAFCCTWHGDDYMNV